MPGSQPDPAATFEWAIFTGVDPDAVGEDGTPRARVRKALPPRPPWRDRKTAAARFQIKPELLTAVNTALHLRRPLLLTGPPGSGKSTLVTRIADELGLGPVLTWHITSRSMLTDGLFEYDALARLHSGQGREDRADPVEDFVRLGPLGTALADPDGPRAVLIDEIDKSDIDLPGDLLHVLDQNEFRIPPLVRDAAKAGRTAEPGQSPKDYPVRGDDDQPYLVPGGVVRGEHPPVIVLTSNGARTFPAPFLRRCVRFAMPLPDQQFLEDLVSKHLGALDLRQREIIADFARRLERNEALALDQLLGLMYLVTGESAPGTEERDRVKKILLAELR